MAPGPVVLLPRDGYYDEDGYWHRAPSDEGAQGRRRQPRRGEHRDRPRETGGRRRQPRPVRDPYYDAYKDDYYDPYGRKVVVRRTRISAPRRFSRSPRTVELGMFSKEEIRDLVIATVVLAVAFAMALGHELLLTDPVGLFVSFLPITLIVTATAFTLHEMAHKFMAQKHGLPAEFVMSQMGIVIALVTAALIGFLFALPGAVVFSGSGADKRTVGKVGAAGPAVNILIGLSLFPFLLLGFQLDIWIAFTIYMVVYINFFLAGFNMIPYGPLDGLKVWKWNPAIYILMMAIIATGFLFVLFFIPMPWPLGP